MEGIPDELRAILGGPAPPTSSSAPVARMPTAGADTLCSGSPEPRAQAHAQDQTPTRSLNWTGEETIKLLKVRFKYVAILGKFATQREKKGEDDNLELVAAALPTRSAAKCCDRLKTLVKQYKIDLATHARNFYRNWNRKGPEYPVYWDLLVDCLAPFPGLRGLTVGGSHVETPEAAGGDLREATPDPRASGPPPSKKQKVGGSSKKVATAAPVVRICESIEKLIGIMGPRENQVAVVPPAVQGEIASLRSDLAFVTTKVDSLADAVGELVQHLRNSCQ